MVQAAVVLIRLGGVLAASSPADNAMLPVLLAMSTNTLSKMAVALIAGGPGYGLRIGAGLLAILTALWLPWLSG